MPPIICGGAAFFAHFHMRDGNIAGVHWRRIDAALQNKLAFDAAKAGSGTKSCRSCRTRNEIPPSADLTRDRMILFHGGVMSGSLFFILIGLKD
jgi:hypothetical protein